MDWVCAFESSGEKTVMVFVRAMQDTIRIAMLSLVSSQLAILLPSTSSPLIVPAEGHDRYHEDSFKVPQAEQVHHLRSIYNPHLWQFQPLVVVVGCCGGSGTG